MLYFIRLYLNYKVGGLLYGEVPTGHLPSKHSKYANILTYKHAELIFWIFVSNANKSEVGGRLYLRHVLIEMKTIIPK